MVKSRSASVRNLSLVSVCIPVLNEEENIFNLYQRLNVLANRMKEICKFEFIFSDNHSDDQTWAVILSLAHNDKRIRAIRFSKNIGFQNSIRLNYLRANGDAIVQIDADLQDPPELIEDFVRAWQNGSKVVSGVRKNRQESEILQIFRKLGYRIIDKLSDNGIKQGVGDFRLLDREVVELIREVRTPSPYLRGVISGFGFKETLIEYDRSSRNFGKSKFGFLQLLKLGITGILNHSKILLKLSMLLSTVTILSAVGLGAYLLFLQIIRPASPKGYTSLAVVNLFGFASIAILLTLLVTYVAAIYVMLNGEEKFIVESEV